jgi:hypothetical protein
MRQAPAGPAGALHESAINFWHTTGRPWSKLRGSGAVTPFDVGLAWE